MKRLVFAPNLCQVINAAAALKQAAMDGDEGSGHDTLVLFGMSPRAEQAAFLEWAARQVWPWKRIEWADDVLVAHFPTRRFAPVARFVLHERLGKQADEVWVSKLSMDSTKLVLHAYPRSRVVLFEDGAEEYIPQHVLCGMDRWRRLPASKRWGALRREWTHWSARSECMERVGVCARSRNRVSQFYSYMHRFLELPDYLKPVPVKSVEPQALRSRFQTLTEQLDPAQRQPPEEKPAKPVILFLPQPFAVLFLTEEDEYALYRAAVSALLEKGYAVWWKEHPRELTPLAPRLQEELGARDIRVLPVQRQMPVECLVSGWPLAGVASVSSTSLIYIHGLYDVPMYTAAGLMDTSKWLQDADRALAEMFTRRIPGVDQLPAS